MRNAPAAVVAIVLSLAIGTFPALAAGQAAQTVTVTGTAKKAKRPYSNYIVRARQVDTGQIAASVPLNGSAGFTFTNMTPAAYLMELVNSQGRVVCTAGPFAVGGAVSSVSIECDRKRPSSAWLLLAAAGAAGVTAAVLAIPSDASGSTDPALNAAFFSSTPASPSR